MQPAGQPGQPALPLNVTIQDPTEYRAEDGKDQRFFIQGRVKGGALSFTIRTRIHSTGERSTIPAQTFFDAMITHFMKEGTPFSIIRGEWSTFPVSYESNLVAFNNYVNAGDSQVVAAGKTFTGRMAANWGYRTIRIVRTTPPGATHNFTDVLVYFEK
jgi:hypothetical protein